MKKTVSLILCFCILFSLAVFSTAEETQDENKPTVYIRVDQSALRAEGAEYARSAFVHAEVFNCPDFEKCEIVVKAPAFALNDPKPERKLREYYDYAEEYDYSDSINSTNTTLAIQKSEDDVFAIHMQTPLSGNLHPFAHIMFATQDRAVWFEPVFESIRLYDSEGEILDFETKIYNPIGQELLVPQICGALTFKTTWNTKQELLSEYPYGKVNISVSIGGIHSVSGMEAVLVYNPEVLRLVPVAAAPDLSAPDMKGYSEAEYEEIAPGKIRIYYDPQGYDGSYAKKLYMPFEFECLGEGETGLSVESYTWLYMEYTANYVQYYLAPKKVLKAVDFDTLDDMPSCVTEWSRDKSVWFIDEGITVTKFRESLLCSCGADIQVYRPDGTVLQDDEFIGTGCVYKVFFDGKEYFTQTLHVKYDIDGDGFCTASDARDMLRASVGLEKLSIAQRHCCETKAPPTAAMARNALRSAVGLPVA